MLKNDFPAAAGHSEPLGVIPSEALYRTVQGEARNLALKRNALRSREAGSSSAIPAAAGRVFRHPGSFHDALA
jgi:hypothetical protein